MDTEIQAPAFAAPLAPMLADGLKARLDRRSVRVAVLTGERQARETVRESLQLELLAEGREVVRLPGGHLNAASIAACLFPGEHDPAQVLRLYQRADAHVAVLVDDAELVPEAALPGLRSLLLEPDTGPALLIMLFGEREAAPVAGWLAEGLDEAALVRESLYEESPHEDGGRPAVSHAAQGPPAEEAVAAEEVAAAEEHPAAVASAPAEPREKTDEFEAFDDERPVVWQPEEAESVAPLDANAAEYRAESVFTAPDEETEPVYEQPPVSVAPYGTAIPVSGPAVTTAAYFPELGGLGGPAAGHEAARAAAREALPPGPAQRESETPPVPFNGSRLRIALPLLLIAVLVGAASWALVHFSADWEQWVRPGRNPASTPSAATGAPNAASPETSTNAPSGNAPAETAAPAVPPPAAPAPADLGPAPSVPAAPPPPEPAAPAASEPVVQPPLVPAEPAASSPSAAPSPTPATPVPAAPAPAASPSGSGSSSAAPSPATAPATEPSSSVPPSIAAPAGNAPQSSEASPPAQQTTGADQPAAAEPSPPGPLPPGAPQVAAALPATASTGPGLLVIARGDDTLRSLYARVYRGQNAPPFDAVAAMNPHELHTGDVVVFPAPAGGWRKAPPEK